MTPRDNYMRQIETALRRSPVTALLGPRQCGKTTLARLFGDRLSATYFDLESERDVRRLANPELVLRELRGLVVLDEIQRLPALFNVLRVLADRPDADARFLILGSASPDLVRGVSESLAGRVEFVELAGFDLSETGVERWRRLWLRGGSPRSYLAESDADSMAWRDGFLRTFLERDIPQLGIATPAAAMRRFWTMLAHWHGRTWNATELGRAMSATDKTMRRYLDLLTGTFMVRQLQPWFQNVAKRQVKAPKVYVRDLGILHTLPDIPNEAALLSHPKVGASWEGFVIEQVLRALRPANAWFWAAHKRRRSGSTRDDRRPSHRFRGEVQRGANGHPRHAQSGRYVAVETPIRRLSYAARLSGRRARQRFASYAGGRPAGAFGAFRELM